MSEAIDRFNQSGIPTYFAPEQAVRAFSYLVQYTHTREVLYETPRDIPVKFPLDRGKLRAVFDTMLSEGHDTLTESTSKALLEAYEIPVAKPFVARSASDAVQLAHRVGYPVAMKVMSPQITHKTDVGGVVLGLAKDEEVTEAFERIVSLAKDKRPDARVEGVTVQKMISNPLGHELIVGAQARCRLRHGAAGGCGGYGGRVVPGPGPGVAAAERTTGAADAGIVAVLAPAEGISRTTAGEHR